MERAALQTLPKYGQTAAQAPYTVPLPGPTASGPRLTTVIYVTPTAPPGPGPIRLAPVIVTAPRARPKLIPQIKETPPMKEVTIDPMLTDEARGEALVEKHLSPLDAHLLNARVMPGRVTNLDRAKQAEAIEQSRKGLNSVADDIALESDPGERKQLMEFYEELYLSRPR